MYQKLFFLISNIFYCLKLHPITPFKINEQFDILSMNKSYINKIDEIYSLFPDGKHMSWEMKILFYLCGKVLVFLLYDKNSHEVIGLEFYYFNKRDIKEHTIHQGFRGILPEFQGKGLGTALTQYAYDVFSKISLKGMSTRVSCNNLSSLISNKKIGFEPAEKYFDSSMDEERYYMICKF